MTISYLISPQLLLRNFVRIRLVDNSMQQIFMTIVVHRNDFIQVTHMCISLSHYYVGSWSSLYEIVVSALRRHYKWKSALEIVPKGDILAPHNILPLLGYKTNLHIFLYCYVNGCGVNQEWGQHIFKWTPNAGRFPNLGEKGEKLEFPCRCLFCVKVGLIFRALSILFCLLFF